MSDETRSDDAALPTWHAEEIVPPGKHAPPPDPEATAPPGATTPPRPVGQPGPTTQAGRTARDSMRPTSAVPHGVVAQPGPAEYSLSTVASTATPADENKRSLVVVAAATAAATTFVLTAVAALGFLYWSRSDDTDTQATSDAVVAAPAQSGDQATDTDESGQPGTSSDAAADATESDAGTSIESESEDGQTSTDQDTTSTDDDTTDQDTPATDQDTAVTDDDTTSADQSESDESEPESESPQVSPNTRPRASAMSFPVAGVDGQGRPVPALPRFLVGTTNRPEQLPNYHPDPERVPESGPYTVAKGGFFFLRGTVPSENLRQELVRRMLLVTSRDSLIIEMVVDENDPWYLDQSIPLYLEDSIRFDVGQADLEIDVLRVFLRIAELVALSPEITLEITGHTDNIGSDESNLALSEERVAQVKEAFVALRAPADQLVTLALGEADPIASNATEAGRAANRRVDFAIVYPPPEEGQG